LKKQILITGASGLVGHGIAKYFLKKNYIVYGTSYKNFIARDLKKLKRIYNFDLTKKKSYSKITDIIKKVDFVIHTAAIIPGKEKNKLNFLKINYEGTKLFLNFCLKKNIKKFIFISTMNLLNKKKYKKGTYLDSKDKAEKYCHKVKKKNIINISVLRIKAPYGFILSNAVIPLFIKNIYEGKNLNLFSDGKRKQIFTFVYDIAKATEILFYKKKFTFNLIGPQIITMKYLAKLVLKVFRKKKDQKILYFKKKEKDENQSLKYKKINFLKFNQIKLFEGLKIIKNYIISNKIYE
jgi:nucleoside-diphosphate-sugar epimerase